MTTSFTAPGGVDSTTAPAGQVWSGRDGAPGAPRLGKPRRRSVPYLVLGVLLVAGCATGAATLFVQRDDRTSVLVLARPVTVGQTLAEADLRQVHIAADPGLNTVPAESADTVIGRQVATSLPAGTLLTRAAVGPPMIPQPGQAVVALALAAGRFPPGLVPGARVMVVRAAATGQSQPETDAGDGSAWLAVVTDVQAAAEEPVTVVSVLVAEADATEVAAVPAGEVAVAVVADGSGR